MENNLPLPISVIIIAKNEEKNLPRCLDAVKDWTSEIVAVINDCTDNTESILKSYGANVQNHPFSNYTDQKNHALSFASQPWVLSLDADEVVTADLKLQITNFIKNPANYEAAYFPRKTHFLGKWISHGDWYPDHVLRLFKKNSGKFTGGNVHEKLTVNGPTKKLPADLLHYSFDSIQTLAEKNMIYANAFMQDNLSKARQSKPLFIVIRSLWKAFRSYFIKLGCLDGFQGFYIASNQFYHTLYKHTKVYEASIKKSSNTVN